MTWCLWWTSCSWRTDEREGKFPFIWTLDKRQHLSRLLVDETMVLSCEERRDFWVMLKAIAEVKPKAPDTTGDLEEKTRRDVVRRIASGLMRMAEGDGALPADLLEGGPDEVIASSASTAPAAGSSDYMAPWLDTDDCTACDECTNLNPAMFAYNDAEEGLYQGPPGGTLPGPGEGGGKMYRPGDSPGLAG